MQNPPNNNDPTRRHITDPSKSQTIPPGGGHSNRPSPPPLYPDYSTNPYADSNEPLPEWVEEIDLNATSVTPAKMPMNRQPSRWMGIRKSASIPVPYKLTFEFKITFQYFINQGILG